MLQKIFGGETKESIWKQIAEDIGGEYIDGGFWKKDWLAYGHQEWTILMDTYVVSTGQTTIPMTRMRAPFLNRDGLYFKIYREGLFSGVAKFFGMQDITIGDPFFDDAFVIKGNHEHQVRRLFADEGLKKLLDVQQKVCLEIRDDEGLFGTQFPAGVDQLHFCVAGIIKDKAALRGLFELFAVTLSRLVHIDSAYENDPGIDLRT